MHALQQAQRKPSCQNRVIINTDPSGAISALNPVTGRVFVINDVARRVLELADGSHTFDDIVNAILEEFKGSERASTERDIQAFLEGCANAQMITWTENNQ